MTMHLEWETLNDCVDDAPLMDASARQAAADHLAECAHCRELLGRLRAMVAGAAEISDVAPPDAAWTAISATIARRKSVSLADRMPAVALPHRRWRVWLGAAVLTVIVSSLLYYSSRPQLPGGRSGDGSVTASLPPEVLRIDHEYGTTADALSAALSEPRVQLNSPGVVESVARSVAVIDIAIAEVRGALIRNPSSDLVRDALVRNYQQKIDLLRRVTARASSN